MQPIDSFFWRFNCLSGNRIHIPGIVQSNSCGFILEKPDEINISDDFPDDPIVHFPQRLLELQLEIDKHARGRLQDIDQAFVAEDIRVIYPSAEAPCDQAPKMSFLTQTLRGQEWESRAKMFDLAFRTNAIYTISIRPKNPNIFQAWYQRQMVTGPKPDEVRENCNKGGAAHTQLPEEDDQIPPTQMGFLKPFRTFSSANYRADPIFDTIEGKELLSPEQIDTELSSIQDSELKQSLNTILNLFLEDEEADSIGLKFRDGARGCVALFHKA